MGQVKYGPEPECSLVISASSRFIKYVHVYFSPNPEWLEASRGCHPVEMGASFPLTMTRVRFKEIRAWARSVPGWHEGLLTAYPTRWTNYLKDPMLYRDPVK